MENSQIMKETNMSNRTRYNFHVDLSKQKDNFSSQQNRLEIKPGAVFGLAGYAAFDLFNSIVLSICNDGQRHFNFF